MGKTSFYDQNFYEYAYEGHDLLETYSPTELIEYRAALLQKTALQSEYIHRLCQVDKLNVIEFCSGNGRLLMSLAQKSLLDFGLGIEIAKSRVEFAEQWRQDNGFDNFKNVSGDVLAYKNIPTSYFDLAVCITAAFQYFYPINPYAPTQILAKMHTALKPGGQLILELYQLTDEKIRLYEISGGHIKLWQELPETDKFRFYLQDVTFWADKNIAKTRKIFIGQDGMIDEGKFHVSYYYSASQITKLLKQNGFGDIKIAGNFKQTEYQEGISEVMVVTAIKQA